jgi:hypothetical protein
VTEATCLALLVVLPAAFNPSGVLAVEPLKASLLRCAALIAGAAWVYARGTRGGRLSGRLGLVERLGLVVLAVSLLSTVVGLYPALSLFGTFDRGAGWLTLAAGTVLLLVGADLWRSPARRERAISALLLGAVFPCAYGLVQRLKLDPLTWNTLGAPGSSMASPTFLGGFLVLLAPLGLYRVVRAGQAAGSGGVVATAKYVGWLALLLLVGATVIATTIRGPLLGLLIGTLTFAGLSVPLVAPRLRRWVVLAGVGFLVVTVALAAVSGEGGARVFGRFAEVARPIDSTSERITVWRDAALLPLAGPPVQPGGESPARAGGAPSAQSVAAPSGNWLRAVVGFGPESQIALLEHAEATVRRSPGQQWDRAHNLWLDTWLTGGALGVMALAGLIVGGLFSAFRARRGRVAGEALLAAALLGALVGHLMEVSFAFHTVVTGAWVYVVLGLCASLVATEREEPRPAPRWVRSAALGSLLLLPVLAAPAVADAVYGQAREAVREGDRRTGALTAEMAAAWAPWVEEVPRYAGLQWQQLATRENDTALFERAESNLQEAARRAPYEPSAHLRLVRHYLSRVDRAAVESDRAALLASAEQSCQGAIAAGPYRPNVWHTCAEVSRRRNLSDEARARAQRAEQLD